MSRVGVKPISIPENVTANISGNAVEIDGPKGKLAFRLPKGVSVEENEGTLVVNRRSELRAHRALHGTVRSIIQNMVAGVSQGFVKELEIRGVGMRAAVKGSELDLSLGKSHEILHPIPSDLTVTVAENTRIRVEGVDKQRVGQFAADVRSYHPPEPYKGKGVRYVGERVRSKEGKSVGK